MQEHSDLKVHVNGKHTFLLNQRILSKFSGRITRLIKEKTEVTQIPILEIKINGFPGGPAGFELAAGFCYKNGRIYLSPSNVSLLHCSALFLEMTEGISNCNLLQQTETFLDGLFYWTWDDVLTALRGCESLLPLSESCGLLEKLISALVLRITANSDISFTPSSSSSSSPEASCLLTLPSIPKGTNGMRKSSKKEWWFDDLTKFSPKIIEMILKAMRTDGAENHSLLVTHFLLHYLKRVLQAPKMIFPRSDYSGITESVVSGAILVGRGAFNCRGFLSVLRVVSCFGLSGNCRSCLEEAIGRMLDQATLDDLLVPGHNGVAYDVNLVLRLLKVFVDEYNSTSLEKMKKVGWLLDMYMVEISPDQSLKASKFLAVAESLPDCARDCFDGVYRAIGIFLESHPSLSSDERSRICRCLNFQKLTLEACKDLAKNPKIPPRIAIQALVCQEPKVCPTADNGSFVSNKFKCRYEQELLNNKDKAMNSDGVRLKIMELERMCTRIKGQMSNIVNSNNAIDSCSPYKTMPRFC